MQMCQVAIISIGNKAVVCICSNVAVYVCRSGQAKQTEILSIFF